MNFQADFEYIFFFDFVLLLRKISYSLEEAFLFSRGKCEKVSRAVTKIVKAEIY